MQTWTHEQRFVSTGQCCTCVKSHGKKWRQNNPEKSRELSRDWRQQKASTPEGRQYLRQICKPGQAKYRKSQKGKQSQLRDYQARQASPARKAAHQIRGVIRRSIVKRGAYKIAKTETLLGCTVAEARAHLESQFLLGMSWDNHGEWHIDHIKPCASFDLTDFEQQKRCMHYTNLQPLWAEDNLRKGARYQ